MATLEQASVWADCIKPLGDRFAYAPSGIHNVDICKPFDLGACKDGNWFPPDRAQRSVARRQERSTASG